MKIKLKEKILTIFVAIGLVPVAIGLTFMYIGSISTLQHSECQSLQNMAQLLSERLSMIINLKVKSLKEFSNDKIIYPFVEHMNRRFEGKSDEYISSYTVSIERDWDRAVKTSPLLRDLTTNRISIYLKNLLDLNREYVELSVIDGYGFVVACTYEPAIISHYKEKWWPFVGMGKTYITDISTDKPRFPFSIIIPLMSGTKMVGAVKADIDSLYISKLIEDKSYYSTQLVNGDGVLINKLLIPRHAQPMIPEKVAAVMYRRSAGYGSYSGKDDILCLMGFSRLFPPKTIKAMNLVDEGQWAVYNTVSAESAYSPITFLMTKSVILGLVMMLILILFGSHFFDKVIKPIRQLEQGLEAITQGDLSTRLDIATGDEIEDLADRFNIMARKLDLTSRAVERQNEELIKLNKIKSNFVSMVSHELRTPLMIIKESVAQLSSGMKGELNEVQAEYLEMCKRNIERLSRIINDLLDISRIEAGKVELRRRLVDISDMITKNIESFKVQTASKEIQLHLRIPKKLSPVYVDLQKIETVLTNLVSNAIKFTNTGGAVTILVEERINAVSISVSDTGIGIPTEKMAKIFDKFEKLKNQPLSGIPSTGLGLSIAQEFVRLHKGKIWVKSEEKRGSTFSFILPKFTEDEFLKEFLTDEIKWADEEGIGMSILGIRLHDIDMCLDLFNVKSPKEAKEAVNRFLVEHGCRTREIIPLTKKPDIYVIVGSGKSGVTTMMDRFIGLFEREKFKGDSESMCKAIHFASVSYPEDGVSVETILYKLGKGLQIGLEPRHEAKPLGEMLVAMNIISRGQLKEALSVQENSSLPLGEVLISKGMVTSKDIGFMLQRQLNIPYANIIDKKPPKTTVRLLDKKFILERKVLPFNKKDNKLYVAMVNPFDINLLSEIEKSTGLEIRPMITTESEFTIFAKNFKY